MRTVKRVAVAIICIITLQSCGQKVEYPTETLKGFMLGGPYIANSFNGLSQMYSQMGLTGDPSEDDILMAYKKNWPFYFNTYNKSGCAGALNNFWEISNKDTTLEMLDILKKEPAQYKAWDYARSVDVAAMGYCAGYLSKEEVNVYLDEVLAKVQEEYPTWKVYFNEYNEGRLEWNPDSPDVKEFSNMVKGLQNDATSIYKLIPLND
ncbi:DUF1266 domain-containing protein [Maribacter sp. 2210JD10-5]|uniref:DUF1266 domain-containing protein n=1 Tax=Maribacter sp. 2210JD10-5 TaxID=3386272 RepID=UPI0039BC93DE